jgi:hypothetical protein
MSSASDMLVAFLSHDTSAIHGVNAEEEGKRLNQVEE